MPRKARSAPAASSGATAKPKTARKPKTAQKATTKPQKAGKAKGKGKTAGKANATPKAVLKAAEGVDVYTVSEEPQKHAGGRPSDYRPEYVEQARKLAAAGFTDQQMADWFECSKPTFYRWCAEHEEFRNSIKMAKDGPDEVMERSLFHRGKGYEWIEQQAIKLREETWVKGEKQVTERVEIVDVRRVVPPDATSAIFWLKNRRGWKDKTEVNHGVTDALAALLGQIDGNGASLF